MKPNDVLTFALIAPPIAAELLKKLLIPLKLSTPLRDVQIAPPSPKILIWLLKNVLFPEKISTVLSIAKIAPQKNSAELLIKMLVSLKVSTTFLAKLMAPPKKAQF